MNFVTLQLLWSLCIGCCFVNLAADETILHPLKNQTTLTSRNYQCSHKSDFRFGQNPPIENHALRNALMRYEELHAVAVNSPHFLEDLQRNISNPNQITHRYFILDLSAGGLGNKLMALMSAFLYALLTDRILLFSSLHFDVNNLLCQPFHESDWITPSEFKWLSVYPFNNNGSVPKIAHVRSEHMYQLLTSLDVSTRYNDSQIMYQSVGFEYTIPSMFLNPVLLPQLNSWFPNRNVATVLTRYLIHPRDDVWSDIIDTWSTRKVSDLTIGIQIRFHAHLDGQIGCLHNLISNSTHVFISSLHDYKQQFHSKHSELSAVTQKYNETNQDEGLAQMKTALHDIWILSLTDETVLSPMSTFGYLSMALKGRPCMYPVQAHIKEASRPLSRNKMLIDNMTNGTAYQCYYAHSHEPCYHRHLVDLPKLVSTEVYISTVERCEDYNNPGGDNGFGIKLSTS